MGRRTSFAIVIIAAAGCCTLAACHQAAGIAGIVLGALLLIGGAAATMLQSGCKTGRPIGACLSIAPVRSDAGAPATKRADAGAAKRDAASKPKPPVRPCLSIRPCLEAPAPKPCLSVLPPPKKKPKPKPKIQICLSMDTIEGSSLMPDGDAMRAAPDHAELLARHRAELPADVVARLSADIDDQEGRA